MNMAPMIWLHQHWQAFRLATSRLATSPVNTALSTVAIGIAASLPAGGWMLLDHTEKLMRSTPAASQMPRISVFMALSADRKAAGEIEAWLKKREGAASVRFVPREDTLARMRTAEGLSDVLDTLPGNPFPDAFVVAPADDRPERMEALAAEFRKLPRVEHVQLDSAWARRLNALLKLGRTGVLMLALLLGVGLTAITFNTIRLQVLSQRAEVEVSRLLGATDAFIRRPFVWFGALLGLLGGIAAWLIVGAATLWLAGPVGELARLYDWNLALNPPGATDSAILMGTATLLGWIGALLSLRQALREDR